MLNYCSKAAAIGGECRRKIVEDVLKAQKEETSKNFTGLRSNLACNKHTDTAG